MAARVVRRGAERAQPNFVRFVRARRGALKPSTARRGVPFQALFEPWVDELVADLPANLHLTEAAAKNRRDSLLPLLAAVAAPLLQDRYERETSAHSTALSRVLEAAVDPDATDCFDRFLGELWDVGFDSAADGFASLVTLLNTVATNWCNAMVEFDQRLTNDWWLLSALVDKNGGDLGRVVSVSPGLGDAHHNGRTVVHVQFESGAALMYKPRSLTGEVAYADIVAWLADRADDESRRFLPGAAAALDRGTHGWMAFVPATPCTSMGEVDEYYRRAGGLLAILHALCATDCHHENIVAAGPLPVLVDCETLASFELAGAAPASTARGVAAALVQNSVLLTGMLPTLQSIATGDTYDSGGLGSGEFQQVDVVRPSWHDVNTDHQRRGPGTITTGPLGNVPVLEGQVMGADAMAERIIEGFESTVDLIRDHSVELLADAGPIERLADLRTRVILRPTQLYADLRTLSLEADAMADPGTYFDRLSGIGDRGLRARWGDLELLAGDIVAAEVEALRSLDIPRFEVEASSGMLVAPEGLAGRVCGASTTGLARVQARIESLSNADTRLQVSIIRGAFHHRAAIRSLVAVLPKPQDHRSIPSPTESDPISDDEARHWVARIATSFHDLAIRGPDGSSCWIVPSVTHHGDRLAIRSMDSSLYQGVSGAAVFLAAAALLSSSGRDEALCRSALVGAVTSTPSDQVGGFSGAGSCAYALSVAGELFNDDSLSAQAADVLESIDAQAVANDTVGDLVVGSAGLALVALRIGRKTGSSHAFALAESCCLRIRELVFERVSDGVGRDDSLDRPVRQLGGLAHGWSGFAVAMARFARETGSTAFEEAIRAALDAERATFDPKSGNWLDLRSEAPEGSAMLGWCSGAPGIGLARLEPGLAGRYERDELATAIAATSGCVVGTRDVLCCGAFGRVAFLHHAGRRMDRTDLLDSARRSAAAVLSNLDTPDRIRLVRHQRSAVAHLGMFQGTGGVGWQLARFVLADALPELLLLE